MAQYIRPGTDTFLTANKLAIPVGPNYRRLLKKLEPDPVRMEFKELFEKVFLFVRVLNRGEAKIDKGREIKACQGRWRSSIIPNRQVSETD